MIQPGSEEWRQDEDTQAKKMRRRGTRLPYIRTLRFIYLMAIFFALIAQMPGATIEVNGRVLTEAEVMAIAPIARKVLYVLLIGIVPILLAIRAVSKPSAYGLRIINSGEIHEAEVVEWVSENDLSNKPIIYQIVCTVETEKYGQIKVYSAEIYYDARKYIETPMKVACFMMKNNPAKYYLDFRGILPGYPGPPLEAQETNQTKEDGGTDNNDSED